MLCLHDRIAQLVLTAAAILVLLAPCSWGEPLNPELRAESGRFRFSFESVKMPNPDARMGLLGFSYLQDISPKCYLGIGGYGSLTGDRGGFFTGGFSGGIRQPLQDNLVLDLGIFIGGGGGGGAAQGGGLMLRPYAALSYSFDRVQLGAGYSRIEFPNGEIDSQQLSLTLDIPFTTLRAAGSADPAEPPATKFSNSPDLRSIHHEFLLKARSYDFSRSSRSTSGTPLRHRLSLVGAEFRWFSGKETFLLAETLGAFDGQADGYAEVMFGAGYRLRPAGGAPVSLLASLAAGGGGGGRIETGGGAVYRAELDLEYHLTATTFVALGGHHFASLDDEAAAWGAGLKLGSRFDTVTGAEYGEPLLPGERLSWARWRLRGTVQNYHQPKRLNVDLIRDVQLVGVKLDRFLQNGFYLSGQASGALRGDAGGYAAGLVGLGWESNIAAPGDWQIGAELAAGAAGGGGIAIGDGFLAQAMAGLGFAISDTLGLQLMIGRTKASGQSLDTKTAEFSICYRFANLLRKIEGSTP